MFDFIYYQDLKYCEYAGQTDSQTDSYKPEVVIKGLRIKGQLKVDHSKDGDTTSCSIVYKTPNKLVTKSLLNGREIMESIPVPGFGVDCGYLNYVK